MMLAAQNTDYGALNQLYHTISSLVAVVLDIGALWWIRPKLANVPEALVKAGEIVLTALVIVFLWTQFSEPSSAPALMRLAVRLGGAFFAGLVVVVVIGIGWTNRKDEDSDDETPVIAGFWPRSGVVKQEGVQGAYRDHAFDEGQVWPVGSRIMAQGLFFIFDLVTAVCGSAALAAVGMLLMMSQLPQIYEFSVSPLEVEDNGTATLYWSVSANAKEINLAPFGTVATSGERPEKIKQNTQFKLTASNGAGSRSVEQGVAVAPPRPKPPPPPKPKKTAKTTKKNEPPSPDIVVEARTCSLILNVVIRGAGWLESENEKDPNQASRASCAVAFPHEGKYEAFITYAAADVWPVRVALNQHIVDDSALAAPTGGWGEPNQKEQPMGVWTVKAGTNEVEFYREHPIPHIQRLRFRPSS